MTFGKGLSAYFSVGAGFWFFGISRQFVEINFGRLDSPRCQVFSRSLDALQRTAPEGDIDLEATCDPVPVGPDGESA